MDIGQNTTESELSEMLKGVILEYGTNPDFLTPEQVREFLNDTYATMSLPHMTDTEFEAFMFEVDENKDGVIEHCELVNAFTPLLQNFASENLKSEDPIFKLKKPIMEKPNLAKMKQSMSTKGQPFISGLGDQIKKFERKKTIHKMLMKGNEEAQQKLEN